MKKITLLVLAMLLNACALIPENRAESNYGIKSSKMVIEEDTYTIGHNTTNRTVYVNKHRSGAEILGGLVLTPVALAITANNLSNGEIECRKGADLYLQRNIDKSCHVYGERVQYLEELAYVFNFACAGQPEVSLIKEED